MTQGQLIAIVGPSGVGKDTVIAAWRAQNPDLHWVTRHITRPVDPSGEHHVPVTEAEFHAAVARDEYALHWAAHGLYYGIPHQSLTPLMRGEPMLINLSRAVLTTAQNQFENFLVIELAARRDVLAQRLAARGRETATEIERRLDRTVDPLPGHITRITIDNSGALPDTVRMLQLALAPKDMT